jgi:type I restriction enzyme S subunit
MALTVPVAEIVENSKNPLLGKHESWGRVLLGEIATIQNGFSFKSSQFTKSEGMPLIRIRDVGADYSDTNYVGDYDPAFVVKASDLLIGMDGDFNCARWRGPDGLLNQRVCRVILKSDIYHPKLLDYALPGYLKAINDMTSSVTVKHLSSKSIAEIPLPLPPKDQQKRIVAEIEKQFSRLDEAVANLKRVKANLKRYKAAVLKAAVEGRLVETESELARREGRSYEAGAQLLQRILETRRSQWKGKGIYKESAAPDTAGLPDLPEGWVWATVGQLAAIKGGKRLPAGHAYAEERTPHPYIRVTDFENYGVRTSELQYLKEETQKEIARYTIASDDIYISIAGSIGLVGQVPVQLSGANLTENAAKITQLEHVAPMYLVYWLSSPRGIGHISDSTIATTQAKLALFRIEQIPVPFPPLPEQNRIVTEVDRHLSFRREAEAQVEINLRRAERLRQSILSWAFTGVRASSTIAHTTL